MINSLKSGSPEAMGATVPVLLTLIVMLWLLMLRSVSLWIGKAPIVGQETGKMTQQVSSGLVVLAIWVLLGGLLLIANVRRVMPARVGFLSWLMLPVSGVLALVAIAAMTIFNCGGRSRFPR